MAYRHLGGPLDGQSRPDLDADYVPVKVEMRHGGGSHPMFTQDAVWKRARIVRAKFTHNGEVFLAEVGQALRQIEDKRGKAVARTSTQVVQSIDASGEIVFDRSGDWHRIAGVDNLEIFEVV